MVEAEPFKFTFLLIDEDTIFELFWKEIIDDEIQQKKYDDKYHNCIQLYFYDKNYYELVIYIYIITYLQQTVASKYPIRQTLCDNYLYWIGGLDYLFNTIFTKKNNRNTVISTWKDYRRKSFHILWVFLSNS